MIRTITVTQDFPMRLGDLLRIRRSDGVLEYLVTSQADKDGRKWEAQITRKPWGTNKEPIMHGGRERRIEKLRSNHFPTPEEIYKRMERD